MKEELICYRNLNTDELFVELTDIIDELTSKSTSEFEISDVVLKDYKIKLSSCVSKLIDFSEKSGFDGNLWRVYITYLLVTSENSYSLACEMNSDNIVSIRSFAENDFVILKKYFDFDLKKLFDLFDMSFLFSICEYKSAFRDNRPYGRNIRDRIRELAIKLGNSENTSEFMDTITRFYEKYGVGEYGLHKAFRIGHDSDKVYIKAINNIQKITFDDLIGYESAKKKLIDNTKAFLEGKPANNCLLYGDAGTGKSSCIKALAGEYFEDGLRIIEVYKHEFKDINNIIEKIKGRAYKFIIYMDDLSFEEFEIEYKYLKAIIEGGLEEKPSNVLIYATSNRRHLIRESFNDKKSLSDDDIHKNDTVQEKLSLSNRFGVTIYFGSPSPKEFETIVTSLAHKYKIKMDEDELLLKARQWEMNHGGLSGRCAKQFVDYLRGF